MLDNIFSKAPPEGGECCGEEGWIKAAHEAAGPERDPTLPYATTTSW